MPSVVDIIKLQDANLRNNREILLSSFRVSHFWSPLIMSEQSGGRSFGSSRRSVSITVGFGSFWDIIISAAVIQFSLHWLSGFKSFSLTSLELQMLTNSCVKLQTVHTIPMTMNKEGKVFFFHLMHTCIPLRLTFDPKTFLSQMTSPLVCTASWMSSFTLHRGSNRA